MVINQQMVGAQGLHPLKIIFNGNWVVANLVVG
jgi:hypothetical protein